MAEVISFKESKPKKFFNKYKKLLIIIATTLALIGGGFILFRSMTSDENSDTNKQVAVTITEISNEYTPCSIKDKDSILTDAQATFLTTFNEGLATVSDRSEKVLKLEQRVLSQKNHLNDANCLHILAMIAIDKSDAKNAENYAKLLEERSKQTSPEIYVLDDDPNFYNQDQLKKSIGTIKANEKLLEEYDKQVNQGDQP